MAGKNKNKKKKQQDDENHEQTVETTKSEPTAEQEQAPAELEVLGQETQIDIVEEEIVLEEDDVKNETLQSIQSKSRSVEVNAEEPPAFSPLSTSQDSERSLRHRVTTNISESSSSDFHEVVPKSRFQKKDKKIASLYDFNLQ